MKGKEKKSAYISRWGGYRESAGRPRKYKPIKLPFEINEEESIIRALKLIPGLLLEDKISTHRARALIYCLKTMFEIIVPFEEIKNTFAEIQREYVNIRLKNAPDPELAAVLKDLPIDLFERIRAAISRKDQAKPTQQDYEKIIDRILDQLPLEERERILTRARELNDKAAETQP